MVAALSLLASCAAIVATAGAAVNDASSPAVIAAAPILRLVADAGPFDGRYTGMVTNVKQARACGSQDSWRGAFVVEGNKFNTNIGKFVLTGDVHPDGSFESSVPVGGTNRLNFTGKIAGDAMHASGAAGLCRWDMDMKKRAA